VLGTGPLLYSGAIRPPFKASDDQFFTGTGDTDIGMRVARNMLTPRVIDVDTFYPPSVQISGGTARTLRPSFFVDKEDFFGRSIFDNQALLGGFFGDFYTGPNYPKIQGGGSLRLHGINFPWPWVADNGVHCGQSGGAYPQTTPLTLPTGRQTGDLLIAFVQIGGEGADKLSRYFTVDDVPIDDPAGDFFAGFTGNEAGLYFANNWSGRFDGADPDVPGYDGWTFSQWVMPGGLPGLSASGPDSLFAMAWRYVDGNETEPVFKWFGQTDTGLGTTAFNPDTGQFELDPENPDLIPGELTLFPMPAERWAGRVIAVRGAARDGFAINTFNYVTNAATGPYPSSTPAGYQRVMHESHFDIATFLFVVTTDNDQTIPKPVSTPANYYPPGEFFLTAAFPTPFVTQLKAPYNRVDVDLDFQDNHPEGSVMVCHRNASSGQRPHETNPIANNASDFGSGIVGEIYHAGGAGFSRLIEQNLTLPVAGTGYPNWTVWGIAISPRYDGDDEFIP